MTDSHLRIAYSILAHKNPDQVSRLLTQIYSPSDYFCISVFRIDEEQSMDCWQNIAVKFGKNVSLVSEYGKSIGTIKLPLANLEAMRIFSEFEYDYFVTLSGQCYPLKPIAEIKERLNERSVAHMEYFKLPSPTHWGRDGGLDRCQQFWFRVRNHDFRLPFPPRNLPYHMKPYGGSAWFCLPKRHVDYILGFVTRKPKLLSFYKHSHIPEEMFFQTILMNSPLRGEVVDKDEWYIDWARAKQGHPPILTKADVPLMLGSHKLFARKFDITVDCEVLDLIDKKSMAMPT
jgi:hypothetical protein